MDQMEERFNIVEESFSTVRLIMERVDARTDQISKACKQNMLISCYITDKLYYHLVDPIIVVKASTRRVLKYFSIR